VLLLVFGVVAWVNGTKDEFYHPEIGSKVNRRYGSSHFCRFILVVYIWLAWNNILDFHSQLTGRAINHATNLCIVVQLGEELGGLLVIPDLCKLESDSASSKRLAIQSALHALIVSVADRFDQRIGVLAGGLSICDADDEDRLAELVAAHLGNDQRIEDLLPQLRAEGSQTLVTLATHDALDLLIRLDVAQLLRWDLLVVHEADFDAIIVEQGGSKCDSLQNKLEVLDALTILFERHGTAVVDVDDDVVESEPDNIIRDLFLNAPCLT
jgi:hypothetical protein